MADREGYSSLEDAAAAALHKAARLGNGKYEYLGGIYEQNGKFYYTEPQTTRGKTSATAKLRVPKGSLRALFHNHPPGRDNEFFSPEDIHVATQLGVPTFIDIGRKGKAGELRVFDPNAPAQTMSKAGHASSRLNKYSLGQPVIAQIPMQEMPKRKKLAGTLKSGR